MKKRTFSPMSIYFRIVAWVFIAALIWGLACPIMISSEYDVLVFLGFFFIFLPPAIAYYMFIPIFKYFNSKK